MNFEANAIYEAKLLLLALPHNSQSDRGLSKRSFMQHPRFVGFRHSLTLWTEVKSSKQEKFSLLLIRKVEDAVKAAAEGIQTPEI